MTASSSDMPWLLCTVIAQASRSGTCVTLARSYGNNHLLPVMINGLCHLHQFLGKLTEATALLAQDRQLFTQVKDSPQYALRLALEWRHILLTEPAGGDPERALAEWRPANPAAHGSHWERLAALWLSDAAMLSGSRWIGATWSSASSAALTIRAMVATVSTG